MERAIIFDNLEKVFKIYKVDKNQIVLEINPTDLQTIATYPFLNGNMRYITVIRGRAKRVYIITNADGTTEEWMYSPSLFTVVSDMRNALRQNVNRFIEDNNILIDYAGETISENGIKIIAHFAGNPKREIYKWELKLGEVSWECKDPVKLDEMIEKCKPYVTADEWVMEENNRVDIRVWRPVNPVVTAV